MMLKPQDLMLALKLLNPQWKDATFAQLAGELGMSASETNEGFHRAREAGLISPLDKTTNKHALAELLIHGLKYVLPVQPGRRTRGMITGFAAPPLDRHFRAAADSYDLMVWPDPTSNHAGYEIKPLSRSACHAAKRDPQLYEWLVLTDVLRGAGRAREKTLAEKILRKRLLDQS